MFHLDFLTFLCRSGVLSSLPKMAVGFCPVGVCPLGFCPSGVLSQWGFFRSPCSLMGISHISKNDFQMLLAVKLVAIIDK